MGWDMAVWGEIVMAPINLEEWLASSCDSSRYDDWPDAFGEATGGEVAVADELARLGAAERGFCNVTVERTIEVRAWLDEDSFHDRGRALATLLRSTGDYGGAGKIRFVGLETTDLAFLLEVAPQKSKVRSMKPAERRKADQTKELAQIHERAASGGSPSLPTIPGGPRAAVATSSVALVSATETGKAGARAKALLALAEVDFPSAERIALAWLRDTGVEVEKGRGKRWLVDERKSRTYLRPAAAEVLARSTDDSALDALIAAVIDTSPDKPQIAWEGASPRAYLTMEAAGASLEGLRHDATSLRVAQALAPGLHCDANGRLVGILAARNELGDADRLVDLVENPERYAAAGLVPSDTHAREVGTEQREQLFALALRAPDPRGVDLAVRILLQEPHRSKPGYVRQLKGFDTSVRPALDRVRQDPRIAEGDGFARDCREALGVLAAGLKAPT